MKWRLPSYHQVNQWFKDDFQRLWLWVILVGAWFTYELMTFKVPLQ
jgi:hypothetical protein